MMPSVELIDTASLRQTFIHIISHSWGRPKDDFLLKLTSSQRVPPQLFLITKWKSYIAPILTKKSAGGSEGVRSSIEGKAPFALLDFLLIKQSIIGGSFS